MNLVTVQVGGREGQCPSRSLFFSTRCGGKAATTGRKEGFAGAAGPRAPAGAGTA